MVFCISRMKSLKSFVPDICGRSWEGAVAFPGCFLGFLMLHGEGGEAANRPQHIAWGHRCPCPDPDPEMAIPRCPPRACFPDRFILLVAEPQRPPASEVV